MKFDYNYIITDLDGKPVTDDQGTELHAGKSLAKILYQSTDPVDALDKLSWSMQLHTSGTVELDSKLDQEKLLQIINNFPGLWVLVRAQLQKPIINHLKK